MTSLSSNFSLEEMTRSQTAVALGIDNTPSEAVTTKLRLLCEKILQPLREAWGKPIEVSSGYRCPTLNSQVGGVKNSDHLHGCAADIKAYGGRDANRQLFDLAVGMMGRQELQDVKQIIDEHGYQWIHISLQDGRTKKRNQVLHL